MTEAPSYVDRARQLLSSKQVPDSGRVCSWRKPMVWPSSCRRIPVRVGEPEVVNAVLSISTLRDERALLGKKARARYWPLTLTGRTSKTTLLLLAVQLPSCALV